MKIYHVKWNSNHWLCFKFVLHYLFRDIAWGQLHRQPPRPPDSEGPLKARFLVVVLENGHEAAAFLQAPLCFRGTEGLCSVTSRSLFLPQINPDVLNQLGCCCLSCLDWEEAGGRWEPHHQKTGWLFRPPVSSSSGVQEAWIRWSWD